MSARPQTETVASPGKFREGWLSDVFTGNMFEIDVTVHSHKSKEGIYMVEEMLG